MISMVMAASLSTVATSQCSWYFVVYAIDNTVGVGLAILFHHLMVKFARSKSRLTTGPVSSVDVQLLLGQADEQKKETIGCWGIVGACGYYGHPPSCQWWGIQLAEWLIAVMLSRLVTGSIVAFCKSFGLVQTATLIDRWFSGHPGALLFTVLIFIPLVANISQALIKDAILKSRLLSRVLLGESTHRVLECTSSVMCSVEDGGSEDMECEAGR